MRVVGPGASSDAVSRDRYVWPGSLQRCDRRRVARDVALAGAHWLRSRLAHGHQHAAGGSARRVEAYSTQQRSAVATATCDVSQMMDRMAAQALRGAVPALALKARLGQL